jgi:nicotinamidase-related amidase
MKNAMPANTALILIDIQQGFDEHAYWGGTRNNPGAESNAKLLLQQWRDKKLPLFHINHNSVNPASPLHPNQPGNAVKEVVKPLPGETVIKKNVHSAFIGTNLKQQLDEQHITAVVIAGLTTDQCVSTTTRMASDYGYQTWLVADASATFAKKDLHGNTIDAETIHQANLASLQKDFATVLNTNDLLALVP